MPKPPPRPKQHCPNCGEEVRAAAQAVTGYVLLLPCGCRSIEQSYIDVLRKLTSA